MGGGRKSSKEINKYEKIKSVRQNMLEFMKIKEIAEINEYRKQMNFPAESTSSINIGSGDGKPTDEETATSNKVNYYNRNSKRGTRLVRSSNNG